MRIAIVIHAYYQQQLDYIADKVSSILHSNYKLDVFVTIAQERFKTLHPIVVGKLSKATVHTVENNGMDLLPFCDLIPLLQEYDWILKLHTKNCHNQMNRLWFQLSVDSLIGSVEIFSETLELLENNENWMMAGSMPFFVSSNKLMLNNQANIHKLAEMWHLDVNEDWGFFAGGFYWVKPQSVLQVATQLSNNRHWFTSEYQPDGLMVHAVERLISRIIMNDGRIGLLLSYKNSKPFGKSVFSYDNSYKYAINKVWMSELLHTYQNNKTERKILSNTQILNKSYYEKITQLEFPDEESLYQHFLLIGQFSTAVKACYPFALRQENSKRIDWEKLRQNTRVKGKVSIIIPVFNNIKITIQCLHSIKKHTDYYDYEVVIIDNGSSHLTKVALELYTLLNNKLRIIRLEQNLNFSIGCNLGFAESDGEYVLFLNNDTLATKGWLPPLLDAIQAEENIAVQPKLLYPDGTIQSAGVEIAEDSFGVNRFEGEREDSHHAHQSSKCSAVTGACFILHYDSFIQVQGFDPLFINGQEDMDLSLKLRNTFKDKCLWYCANSHITHLTSQTEGRGKYIAQNRAIFRSKWMDF